MCFAAINLCANMKYLLVLFALAGAALATRDVFARKHLPIKKETVKKLVDRIFYLKAEQRLELNINNEIDEVFAELSKLMLENQLDPLDMPDIHEAFEHKPLLITYHGELDLTEGWLQDISTIFRNGDADLKIENDFIFVKLPVAFKDLIVGYKYSAKLMDLGPVGSIQAKVYDVGTYIEILIDIQTMEAMLMDFQLKAGNIDVKLYGNPLVDWFFNIIIEITTTVLHDTVIYIAEGIVEDVLRDVVEVINVILGDLLTEQVAVKELPIRNVPIENVIRL